MRSEPTPDYYEVLQISQSAETETIQRVFRLFARRFHPDNKETGSEAKFRVIQEAYHTLSDPEKRAQYDVLHSQLRQDRWKLVSSGARAENNFQLEAQSRLTVLEVLYTHRRLDPQAPGIFYLDLENLTGLAREHLMFTIWYLVQQGLAERGDNSRLNITVKGVDHLEKNYEANILRRRLEEHSSGQPAS